jgi:hypothetical protein
VPTASAAPIQRQDADSVQERYGAEGDEGGSHDLAVKATGLHAFVKHAAPALSSARAQITPRVTEVTPSNAVATMATRGEPQRRSSTLRLARSLSALAAASGMVGRFFLDPLA